MIGATISHYRLTQIKQDTGYTGEPALAPDGRFLAYASDRAGEGNLDIRVQALGGGDPIRLTTDEADEDRPSFSPTAIASFFGPVGTAAWAGGSE